MSSNFKKLLGLLLNRAALTASPVFPESELTGIDPKGFQRLLQEDVLGRDGLATTIDHPDHGRMDARKVGSGWMLEHSESPGQDWLPVGEESLRLVRFHHQGMLRWLSRTNGMEGQATEEGRIWTVGTRNLGGLHCQVLYYPGIADPAQLHLALDSLDDTPAGTVRLVVLAGAISLPDDYKTKLAARRIHIDYLYRHATDDGIDLNKASLPQLGATREPGCYFRRSGNGWEVGFNTNEPSAVVDTVDMFPIWYLLRNPRDDFSAADINNAFNAVSPDRLIDGKPMGQRVAPARSSGTMARRISDLPADDQREFRELFKDKLETKKADGKDSVQYRDANEAYKHFLKAHGIKGSFAGMEQREGDDAKKEAATVAAGVRRWIRNHLKTKDLRSLAEHLKTHLQCGARFSYGRDKTELPQWHT